MQEERWRRKRQDGAIERAGIGAPLKLVGPLAEHRLVHPIVIGNGEIERLDAHRPHPSAHQLRPRDEVGHLDGELGRHGAERFVFDRPPVERCLHLGGGVGGEPRGELEHVKMQPRKLDRIERVHWTTTSAPERATRGPVYTNSPARGDAFLPRALEGAPLARATRLQRTEMTASHVAKLVSSRYERGTAGGERRSRGRSR